METNRPGRSIVDRVHVLRSKNAGPFTVTFDVVLNSRGDFDAILGGLTRESVAEAYGLSLADVTSISSLQRLNAIKICVNRRRPAGHPGDSDCYGMNQEEPLARLLQRIAE